jgi:hypothetical protein
VLQESEDGEERLALVRELLELLGSGNQQNRG